jgi:PKD repeat protein
VNGRLLIKISEPGKEIKQFEKELKGLKNGETLSIQESWKTTELKKGMVYTLTGIAYYESEATTPILLTLSTNQPPIAKFTTNPVILEIGKEITFDATSSSDPDGEIVSYHWDFGDNLTGQDKTVNHLYNIAGSYPVKLTLTDNAGESSEITTSIKVIAQSGGEIPSKIVIKLYIGQKSYYVNDIKKEMDTEPIIFQGRTLLPIRYVAEALGATVGWVQAEQKATIVLGETNIELWIGKNSAKVNGEYKLIDASNPEVKPIVVPPGRTMLPIRFVAETLGCQVDWNQASKEVKITYPK